MAEMDPMAARRERPKARERTPPNSGGPKGDRWKPMETKGETALKMIGQTMTYTHDLQIVLEYLRDIVCVSKSNDKLPVNGRFS